MPGLLRGMARTAVVAGTATAASNRVSRRQAQRWSADNSSASYAQEQQPPSNDTDYQMVQLEKLGRLRDQGILTEEEFAAKKQQMLGI
jgi:hypothetical protein